MRDNRLASPEDCGLVSHYLVWYSIILVFTGLLLRVFDVPTATLPAIWIILATLVINIGVKTRGEWLPFRTPSWFRDWRVEVNIVADLVLIYLMMTTWPEIWLLFLMMGISLAVYDSLDATLFHCSIFACILLLFAWMKDTAHSYHLGQTLMYGATIVFIGLFVNRLVNVFRSSPMVQKGGTNVPANPEELSRKMMLVSRHMTPFAALLVLMGLVFGQLPPRESYWVLGILAVTVLVNFSSMIQVKKDNTLAPIMRKLRMAVNVIGDLWLIWIFLPYWPEAWLLLLLMCVAQGVYGTRQSTWLWSSGCAFALLAIAGMRGIASRFWIPEALVYGVTYIFVGLYINRLVFLLKNNALPTYAEQAAR